jgi:hypothetical protein
VIALVGPFDVPSLSVQLARRVIEAELHDRCPDVEVRVFAPTAGATGLDPVEPLGPPDPGRVAAFTATFPTVVVVGDAGVTAAWAAAPAHVVPWRGEAGHVAARLVTRDQLAARREFLVGMEWWPARGAVTVVQGAGEDAGPAAGAVVRIAAEPGDPDVPFALGAGATVDDLLTAIALADDVVATGPGVRAVAAAFRGGEAGEVVALDAWFDALAQQVTGRPVERFAGSERDALRRALDARGRRLAAERSAMADRVWAIERHLEGQLAERDARIAALEAERDALRARIEVRVRAALGRVARRRPFPKP